LIISLYKQVNKKLSSSYSCDKNRKVDGVLIYYPSCYELSANRTSLKKMKRKFYLII